MNLFLAACYTNNYMRGQRQHNDLNDIEKNVTYKVPNILESYHYVGKQKFVDEMRNNNAKIFLDSGAFSAMSLGIDIDIDEYCRYVIENKDIIRVEDNIIMASVLDGIGDPLLTWQNQQYMERKGATPLPCFHFGEDEKYLEWYVKYYPYITIGGMVRTKAEDVMQWLDRIWNKYLVDGSGRPKLKVHAFGVTTVSLMERYPWHSVDSSTWIQATAFGGIYTTEFGNISVSDKSPNRHTINQHFSTLPKESQEVLHKLLDDKGFNAERLSTVYQSRAAYNMLAYMELNDVINTKHNSVSSLDFFHQQQLF